MMFNQLMCTCGDPNPASCGPRVTPTKQASRHQTEKRAAHSRQSSTYPERISVGQNPPVSSSWGLLKTPNHRHYISCGCVLGVAKSGRYPLETSGKCQQNYCQQGVIKNEEFLECLCQGFSCLFGEFRIKVAKIRLVDRVGVDFVAC